MTVAEVAITDKGSFLTARAAGVEIFRYEYARDLPQFEGPAPYFHPIRTLAGDVVTTTRPHDHRWHKGLAMTASHVSGQNFWGGGTYTPGAPGFGYLNLPNVGSLAHRGFSGPPGPAGFTEEVEWITATGQSWIEETRTVSVAGIDVIAGVWSLLFETVLRNVSGRDLEFGSPTVFGRELAGYCGFFWRGPRSFTGGRILAADGQEGEEVMGKPGAWLAFSGRHDEVDRAATLIFQTDPAQVGVAHRWFVRNTPFAAVNPSLAFFDPLPFAEGAALAVRYRVAFADGFWERDQIEDHVRDITW